MLEQIVVISVKAIQIFEHPTTDMGTCCDTAFQMRELVLQPAVILTIEKKALRFNAQKYIPPSRMKLAGRERFFDSPAFHGCPTCAGRTLSKLLVCS